MRWEYAVEMDLLPSKLPVGRLIFLVWGWYVTRIEESAPNEQLKDSCGLTFYGNVNEKSVKIGEELTGILDLETKLLFKKILASPGRRIYSEVFFT
jgi:hypothetical protein